MIVKTNVKKFPGCFKWRMSEWQKLRFIQDIPKLAVLSGIVKPPPSAEFNMNDELVDVSNALEIVQSASLVLVFGRD